CARPGDVGLAGGQRLGIELAADDEVGAAAADARDLGGGGDLRHEDARPVPQLARRIGHRRAVIAARGGRDSRRRHPAAEQIGEGAAHLERARMLGELELEGEREVLETEVASAHGEDGCAPDVAGNAPAGLGNGRGRDVASVTHVRSKPFRYCCGVNPEALTAGAHSSESFFWIAASSAGVVPVGTSPNARSRSFVAGVRTPATMAPLSRATTSAGVPAGAYTAYHPAPSMS